MRLSVASIVVAVSGCACLAAALIAGACVIAPPAELPPVVPLPPRILHDSVMPPAGFPLTAWPDVSYELLVPVVVEDPYGQYDYRVLVDPTQWSEPLVSQPVPPPVVGGRAMLSIHINPQQQNRVIDLGACHKIEVVVARSFLPPPFLMPDPLSGDSVSWPYYPSSAPYACTVDDAGAGAILDGSTEGLPVPPLSDGSDR